MNAMFACYLHLNENIVYIYDAQFLTPLSGT